MPRCLVLQEDTPLPLIVFIMIAVGFLCILLLFECICDLIKVVTINFNHIKELNGKFGSIGYGEFASSIGPSITSNPVIISDHCTKLSSFFLILQTLQLPYLTFMDLTVSRYIWHDNLYSEVFAAIMHTNCSEIPCLRSAGHIYSGIFFISGCPVNKIRACLNVNRSSLGKNPLSANVE